MSQPVQQLAPESHIRRTPLRIGDPAPWVTLRASDNRMVRLDTCAGRYLVLCFFESAAEETSRRMIASLAAPPLLFDGQDIALFGISTDPEDEAQRRLQRTPPGIEFLWDFDHAVSSRFGLVANRRASALTAPSYQRTTFILDPQLRVLAVEPMGDASEHAAKVRAILAQLPPLGTSTPAPVLIVPRLFEPDLCRELIAYYERFGGRESGFMRDVNGKTVGAYDFGFKRRRDQIVSDPDLKKTTTVRIHDRLAPEIHKAFQFRATHMERHIVACYDSATGGFFRPHRDNTIRGTAHRRFAVSINLNTGEYDGGELRFPEFGRQTYCAPLGGAVVFSCTLLHEATPVTRGKRYAFLPFLYDEAASRIRAQNERDFMQ